MANPRFNKQVANPMKKGGRVKKMGGGMSTRRRDMKSGYYENDMAVSYTHLTLPTKRIV